MDGLDTQPRGNQTTTRGCFHGRPDKEPVGAPRVCVFSRGRSDNEPSDEYGVVCTYITVINHMNVWPAGQDPTQPARGQQQQLSLHLEHEFLHSHDGHAQEVHPHDLHVVASGHAHLSGPQASQSFGQHALSVDSDCTVRAATRVGRETTRTARGAVLDNTKSGICVLFTLTAETLSIVASRNGPRVSNLVVGTCPPYTIDA